MMLLMLPLGIPARAGDSIRIGDPSRVGKLVLILNKSRTIRATEPFGQALIANSDVADLVPLTDQSLYIVGKKIGSTRLTILDANKHLLSVYEVEVTFDVAALGANLRHSVPGSDIHLSTANGRILLNGSVPDAVALSKAIAIVEQYTADCESQQLREISSSLGGGGQPAPASAAQPSPIPNAAPAGNGEVGGLSSVQAAGRLSKCYINSLVVRAPQQVLLAVRFVEVERTAARDLGFAWDVRSNALAAFGGQLGFAGNGLAPSPGQPIGNGSTDTPFGTFLAHFLAEGTSVDILIQALEKRGLARRLAEPNLVALSGDTANFLAGGEFPFPVAQQASTPDAAGLVTIQFKKFGVGLAFTPTVLADGQINLKIDPEVSDIDPSQTFSFGGGITVPGLSVRRASTTIEMRDGQSFAIAGLLQTRHTKDDNQIPWLGSVPVLGVLFSSSSYQKEESDLVIIVTPHLVRPAVPGQQLATPFDERLAANDRDYFLGRSLEVDAKEPGPYGHILDLNNWATSTRGAGQ
jgi:pilus assembly protein CpaC